MEKNKQRLESNIDSLIPLDPKFAANKRMVVLVEDLNSLVSLELAQWKREELKIEWK